MPRRNRRSSVTKGSHKEDIDSISIGTIPRRSRLIADGSARKMTSKLLKRSNSNADRKVYKYIFIGGGISAGYFAATFVEEGLRRGDLCIISGEDVPPYEKTELMTHYVESPESFSEYFTCSPKHSREWYMQSGIDLYLETWVTEFDEEKRICKTNNGTTFRATDAVIIGTGCRPARLPVTSVPTTIDSGLVDPGMVSKTPKRHNCYNIASLEDISGLYTLAVKWDADDILDFINKNKPKRAVVIGASATGLSACAFLATRVPTTLVTRGPRVMLETVPEQISIGYANVLEAGGVDLVFNAKVMELLAADGKFIGMRTTDGRFIEADMCIQTIGRVPNVDVFRSTGLVSKCRGRQAIHVDSSLETNTPGVFAVGDVISLPLQQFNGHGVSCGLQSADHARRSAAHVVRSILSPDPDFRKPYDYFPILYSHFMDRSWRMYGDSGSQETIVIGTAETKAVALYVWDARIVGAFIESGSRMENVLLEAVARQQCRVDVAAARAATTVAELIEIACAQLRTANLVAGTNPTNSKFTP